MTDPIATLRAYLNANLDELRAGQPGPWSAHGSASPYGDLDNILDLLPDVFAEVERAHSRIARLEADTHDAINAFQEVLPSRDWSLVWLAKEAAREVLDSRAGNISADFRTRVASLVSAFWAYNDRDRDEDTLPIRNVELRSAFRVVEAYLRQPHTTETDLLVRADQASTTLSQCQVDLAAMTAERDTMQARCVEWARTYANFVVSRDASRDQARADLAAARGALETTRAVLLGALDRWNGDVTERGEGRLVDAVRRVTDDLQSLTASGGEGE